VKKQNGRDDEARTPAAKSALHPAETKKDRIKFTFRAPKKAFELALDLHECV